MKRRFSQNLVDKNKYQVFLCTSPAPLPVSCAVHAFFIVNRKGDCARWETLMLDSKIGHVHKNSFPFACGINIFPVTHRFLWKSVLIGIIEGDMAKKMIDVIENSHVTYPREHKYFLIGPNSNTYVEWILEQFPNAGLCLPWNAFGKNYSKKIHFQNFDI